MQLVLLQSIDLSDWLVWIWFALAVTFAVAEIFTAGFFLICFSAGAAAAALLAFIGLDPLWQLAAFVAVSAAAVVYSRTFADRISNPNTHMVGIDRVLGREAIVVEAIDPISARGVVRIGHENWSADSLDGSPIAAGARVQVIAVEGSHVKVSPL